jgi:short-subunit dehydrogenase
MEDSPMEISGKVVLITGASAGIGQATARRFAAAGAKVVLVARSAEPLQNLAAEIRAHGNEVLVRPTDMRDLNDIPRMVAEAYAHFGRIDILINNAGQAVAGTVADLNIEDFRAVLELNVMGPLRAMQSVIPFLRKGGGGIIINVSSMVSKMFLPGLAGYAATKSALNTISGTARLELAPENIRVITMYPRMTATNFGENSIGNKQMRQRQRESAPRAEIVVDTAEQVAAKIVEAARAEPAEQYMEEGAPPARR